METMARHSCEILHYLFIFNCKKKSQTNNLYLMYGLCLLFHRLTVKLSNRIFHVTREALGELCRWCQMDGQILTAFNVSTTNIRHEAKYFMLILNVVKSPQYWQCRGCWIELKTYKEKNICLVNYYIAACLSIVMFYHYWTLSLSILSSLPVEVPGAVSWTSSYCYVWRNCCREWWCWLWHPGAGGAVASGWELAGWSMEVDPWRVIHGRCRISIRHPGSGVNKPHNTAMVTKHSQIVTGIKKYI